MIGLYFEVLPTWLGVMLPVLWGCGLGFFIGYWCNEWESNRSAKRAF